ncbi:MAG: hypothetical protein NTY70_02090 [Burkholderiales bacterium]|nr:hypothetical protein [Burkholderiales bacterium]
MSVKQRKWRPASRKLSLLSVARVAAEFRYFLVRGGTSQKARNEASITIRKKEIEKMKLKIKKP